MSKKVIIVGYFQEVVELCERCGLDVVGVFDNNIESKSDTGYPILGKDSDAQDLFLKYGKTPLILSPDLPEIREKLAEYYGKIGYEFLSIISPDSQISPSAVLGIGVFVQSGVHISSNTKIGDFVRLNTYANVMHDCNIDSFSTIAPNAVLLGNVKVGKSSYIGSNATILPRCIIGENSIVGAGCVVTKNVDNATVVIGNPSRVLRVK